MCPGFRPIWFMFAYLLQFILFISYALVITLNVVKYCLLSHWKTFKVFEYQNDSKVILCFMLIFRSILAFNRLHYFCGLKQVFFIEIWSKIVPFTYYCFSENGSASYSLTRYISVTSMVEFCGSESTGNRF